MRSTRSLVLSGVVAATSLALVAPAGAAPPQATVRVVTPQHVLKGEMIPVELVVSGAHVAGIQATVDVNGKAAEVGGIAPAGKARSLNPVITKHGATVGAYALKGVSGKAATVAVFPMVQGRVDINVGRIEIVDANGKRIVAKLVGTSSTVQVGAGTHHYRTVAPGSAPAGSRHPVKADIDGNGIVTLQDLNQTLYGWSAGNADGDADGNKRVDVADVQSVYTRIAPKLRALPTPKVTTPLTPSTSPTVPLVPTFPALSGDAAAAAAVPMTFTVNTTADAVDANPGDKICATAAGTCSLRAAIDEANRNAAADTINFNIPGGAPAVIHLTLGKLTMNAPNTTINGYSEPGASQNTAPLADNAVMGVEITGNGDAAKEALYITSSGITITGIAIHGLWKNIWMSQGANNNTIAGNYVGITGTGGNPGYSGLNGILMDAGSNHNNIGLPTLAGRNIIGNVGEGIDFYNSGTDFNLSRNNYVGISPDGTQVYGIGDNGMDHNFGPKNNTAGGTGPLDRNVFVGAGNDGVEYSHGWNGALAPHQDLSLPYQINDNQLIGNYIGFKPDGSYDPNFADGTCWPGCETNDNGQGLNVIDGANRTIVSGNYIAGNRNGVQVEADWSHGNQIINNHIGVSPTGQNAVIHDNGVFLHWDVKTTTVSGNDIRNAGMAGIALDSPSVYDNLLSKNTFRNIGGLGIDNYPLGAVNVNGAATNGSNHAVFYPVITSATPTTVSGTAPKSAVVEIYSTFGLPGVYGPGRTYLTSVTANASTGAFSAAVSLNPGDVVTSTATVGTSPNLDTSEFGVNVAVPGAPVTQHGAEFSDWENFGGTALTNIPAGTVANSVTTVGSMETPVNRGDNLGSRLQAYLTPPTTGTYTFWMASDDNGRLFLSTDNDPQNRQQIASVDVWTNSEAYDTYPSQQSAPVNLIAGHKYYIEAWAKEGSGGDNLSVAWSGPGLTRQVISDDYLTATTDGCTGWCPNVSVKPYKAQLVSFAGKCADVYGGQPNDGSLVTDYTCNNGVNQTWTLASNGELQSFDPAHCAQVQGGLTAGSSVFLAPCDGSASETFSYSASGQLKIGGLCLEVPGANSGDGVQLQVNTCNGNAEQGWLFQTQTTTYTPGAPSLATPSTTTVSGTTCADCTVKIYSSTGNAGDNGPGSTLLGTVTADGNGAFSFTAGAGVLVGGTLVTAMATTPLGVSSGFAPNVAVVDNTPPPPAPGVPTNLAGDTGLITGNADNGSIVKIYSSTGNAGDNGPASTLVATLPATTGGAFSYVIQPTDNLVAGTIITATASNAGGTSGPAVNVAITQALPPAPAAPTGLAGDTGTITGNAQAGSTVKIYTSTGAAGANGPASTLVATVIATPGATFSYVIQPGDNLVAGTIITASATNAGGTSPLATNVAITQALPPAPPAPTSLAGTTATITGNAQAGSSVKIYTSTGAAGANGPASTLVATVIATPGATFSYAVQAGDNLAAGTIITATATNAGGTSTPAVNVALTQALPAAPAAPTGLSASLASISGNAEPNSTVTIYKTSGAAGQNGPGTTQLAQIPVTSGGTFTWAVAPAGALNPGDVVTATASNAGGTGPFATNVALAAAPAAPTGLAASTTTVTGSAVAGSTVTVFKTSGAAGANGPGTTQLAQVTATGGTFSATVTLNAGDVVTATATTANGTSGFAVNVTATAVVTPPLAADSFARIIANGWGTATTGGAYSLFSTVADYAVDGSNGTMRLAAGNTREVWLNSVSAANVNSTVTFSLDKLPTANTFVYLTARRTAAGSNYRAVVRLQPNGQMYAYVTKNIGSTETTLSAVPLLAGLTVAPGAKFHVRLVVTGTNPSTIKVTVWADGSAEPAAQVTQTDSTADLQVAGAVGLRAYTGAATTNAPITARFSNWSVTAAS